MWTYNHTNELYHFGIKGMKWGVRKNSYRSTGLRSALARRSNEKVDKSFKNWKDNAAKRDDAINLGKSSNLAKIAYEKDRTNKSLKKEYKTANKAYKKALRQNTTYRKGVVRQEVGRDISRKYMSEAKKVQKQMESDPNNKNLQKQYNDLMSKHDVERARARRATTVATNRMRAKAALKRGMTMTVKAATATALVTIGAAAANGYLSGHNVTLDGKPLRVKAEDVRKYASVGKKILDIAKYI